MTFIMSFQLQKRSLNRENRELISRFSFEFLSKSRLHLLLFLVRAVLYYPQCIKYKMAIHCNMA